MELIAAVEDDDIPDASILELLGIRKFSQPGGGLSRDVRAAGAWIVAGKALSFEATANTCKMRANL
jgi:hypothetical protein